MPLIEEEDGEDGEDGEDDPGPLTERASDEPSLPFEGEMEEEGSWELKWRKTFSSLETLFQSRPSLLFTAVKAERLLQMAR